jgi:outer membrane protein TolC
MQFHFTDAIHRPDITAWQSDARTHASEATRNQVLLDTSLAYLSLLEAWQQKAIAEETLRHAEELAELTRSFAETGQGLQADADRAATELTIRQNGIERAREAVGVASARLAQQLSIDPSLVILPTEMTLIPMELISCEQTAQELVALGLRTRPELAENTALVQAAAKELERVRHAPLLPSVLLGMSYGGFGGGVGDSIAHFEDRFDFEATAYWQVRNLGFGERAARTEALSQEQQAHIRQVRLLDQVAREVVEAQTQVEARKRQIETAQKGIQAAQDSYRRNRERIQDGEGLPIEVLQSLQALDAARREYLRAVISYNEAQFRLQWAIGWPIEDR